MEEGVWRVCGGGYMEEGVQVKVCKGGKPILD